MICYLKLNCEYVQHEKQPITGVCLHSDCQTTYSCQFCMDTKHKEHKDFVKTFSEIQELIDYNIRVLTILTPQFTLLNHQIDKILIKSQTDKLLLVRNYYEKKEGIFSILATLKKENELYQQLIKDADLKKDVQSLFEVVLKHIKRDYQLKQKMLQFETQPLEENREDEENQEINQLCKQANDFLYHAQYSKSLKCLDLALQINPISSKALLKKCIKITTLGETLEFQDKYSEAIKCLNQILQVNPLNRIAHMKKIRLLGELDRFEDATNWYNYAKGFFKKPSLICYYKSLNMIQLDFFPFTKQFKYSFYNRLDDNDTLLGSTYLCGSDKQPAWLNLVSDQLLINKVNLKEKPGYIDLYLITGFALYNKDQIEEALSTLTWVRDFDPKNIKVHLAIGLCLFASARYKDAIDSYDRALDIDPSCQVANFHKGRAFHQLHLFKEAITIYDSLMQLQPNDTLLLSNKGSALHKLKQYGEAIKWFDKAIQTDQSNALAYQNKGLSLFYQEKYLEAIQIFDQALKIWPYFSQACFNKANCYNKIQYYLEAVKWYIYAIYLDPDNAKIYKRKGDALFQHNQTEEAIQEYLISIEKGWKEDDEEQEEDFKII